MKQKKLLMLIAMVLVVVLCASVLTACKKDKGKDNKPYDITKRASTGWEDSRQYTLREYTAQLPGQWCTILSSDSVDNDMESYMTSAFYEFNYKFDANGKIVPGAYTVEYSAATKLEDVTKKYAGQYGLAADAKKGQAFAMTLRNDLKWDDGTPIKAADFVYTMSQQLSPKYLFDTASNYYSGNYVIHNAENYVKQGQKGMFPAYSVMKEYNVADDAKLIYSTTNSRVAENGFTPEVIVEEFGIEGMTVEKINALNGKSLADIKKDATLNETWEALLGAWKTDPNEELDFFETEYEFPAMDFSEVGYFVGENEYELVMVIDGTLKPLDEEGKLTYEAGYYFSNWPLVKKDLWEKCEDQSKTPYANSYCTSLEKSASWGPYKLTNYQDDKTYTVSRNDKWFGYGLEQYAKQYQTDTIITNKIPEWDTAWLSFQNGDLDSISMDVKIASDYRTSRQAFFTPDTATGCLNLQSLATSRTDKRNNLLLNYDDFRKAISLALNRDDYCAKNRPSSQAALGLLNSMYYNDVENGKVYRDSVQAKEAILNAYGAEKVEGGWKVGTVVYKDIDEAVDAMTGYNVTLARQLMTSAYNKAKADGKYSDGEKIVLTFGVSEITANTDRTKNWFQAAFDDATKGTALEGKISIEYFIFSDKTWSEQFKKGEYDLCFGAWSNAPFNPSYLLCETQINENVRWAKGWDPTKVNVSVKATPDADHKDGIYTYNLEQWRLILQGKEGCPVNFKKNFSMKDQLTALGAVEAAILKEYYSVPVFSLYSASLMGYKTDYVTYEYNTFMGYGGIRYMSYNFDDTEWAAFVSEKGGTLNYKFGK